MRLDTLVVAVTLATAACGSPDASERATGAEPAESPTAQLAGGTTADGVGAVGGEATPGGALPSSAGAAGGPPGRAAAGRTGAAAAGPPEPSEPAAAAPSDTEGSGQDQPDGANEILRRAERAYADVHSMQADFVQQVTIPLLDQTRRSRGRIYHRRPDRFLMDFSDPDGDVIVADGRYLWMYYPSTDPRQVLRTTLAAAGGSVDLQRELLSDATSRYAAAHIGTEPVGDRPADVLRLTPRQPSQYRQVKIWVDRRDSMVRRFEIVEQNESVRLLELSNLRPNVTLGDALFTFEPPPDAEIFDS